MLKPLAFTECAPTPMLDMAFATYIKLKDLDFFIFSVDRLISICAGPLWVSGYKLVFGPVKVVEIFLFASVGSGVDDEHFLFEFSVSLLF